MRFASVFRRQGKTIIHSASRTVSGVVQCHEPFLVLGPDATSAVLGSGLRDCLDASREGVENRDSLPGLLAAVGVKSWGTLVRGARSVEVVDDGTAIRLVPMKNKGAREGFTFLRNEEVRAPRNGTPEQIGIAIGEALEKAIE